MTRNDRSTPARGGASGQTAASAVKRFWWLGCLVGCVAGGVVLLVFLRGGHVYRGAGYEVTYPEGWQPIGFELVDVAFVAPETTEEAAFRSNINIVVTPRGDDIATTGKTFQNIVESLDSPDNGFTLLEKHDDVINGHKSASLHYAVTRQGQRLQGTIVLVDGIRTYIFSYTTLEPLHAKHMAAFQATVESLREK